MMMVTTMTTIIVTVFCLRLRLQIKIENDVMKKERLLE